MIISVTESVVQIDNTPLTFIRQNEKLLIKVSDLPGATIPPKEFIECEDIQLLIGFMTKRHPSQDIHTFVAEELAKDYPMPQGWYFCPHLAVRYLAEFNGYLEAWVFDEVLRLVKEGV